MLGYFRTELSKLDGYCCLTLSIHLHHRQGEPPPFNLSSRPEQSVGEGPAVCAAWRNGTRRRFAHGAFAVPESETAGPSPTLCSGRDDKLKGVGPPWRWWRWMDRVKQQDPPHLPKTANLDSSDFQPSLRDSILEPSVLTLTLYPWVAERPISVRDGTRCPKVDI